jgi:predicted nucleotidyltransferase component of viral defense system
MILHEDKKLFSQSVQATAQQMNIPEIYVEKDYWVTYALRTIFSDKIGEETVFKGGTALSKCFNIIDRFSEDIDLVVFKREGETNNQLTNKIKRISEVVASVLPEIEIADVTNKRGMNRKTAHTYSKEFNGEFGQVRDVIIVEATWLGSTEPYTEKTINTLIYDMMVKTKQQALAEKYNLLQFEVKVLELTRTICEKIMSLVKFSYCDEPLEDLKRKVRHTYDLHKLLENEQLSEFFNSVEFEKMLIKVANDDVISYKNRNEWLANHPKDSIIFDKLDTTWEELKKTYNSEFKNLVFGELPTDTDVLSTMRRIKERLKSINWNINPK